MRNRITILALTGICYLTACSFTDRNSAANDNKITSEINSNPKDLDVQMVLSGLGISTTVDANQYPSVQLTTVKGFNLGFSNPTAKNYTLNVFDNEGNLVASVDNINTSSVSLSASLFNKGSYIYKLSGEGNTFAGKFFCE